MHKNILSSGILFLIIVVGFMSIVYGHTNNIVFEKKSIEIRKSIEDLNFVCSDRNLGSKLEYYKTYLLRDKLNNDLNIVNERRELKVPIKKSIVSSFNSPMDSAWPMQSYDNHHTGRSPYSTADNPYDEIWRFYSTGWIEDTPVISDDGTIYVGGGYGALPWYLIAINPDGTEKWNYKTGGLIWGSSPAIAEDGTIYVGSWDCRLHAINPDGTKKWTCPSNSANIHSSPAIAEDGTIYFGTAWSLGDGGKIHAINPDGTEKWRYQTGYHITSDPAIGNDGIIYIGSGDTYLYAMWPNGTLKWRFKTGDEIHGHPSIAEDGTIYIGSWDNYLYALNTDGTLKWKTHTGWGTSNSQAIDNDGTIYVGTNKLYAIHPNGTIKWSFNLGTNRKVGKSSPAISADGTIYIGVEIHDNAGAEIIAVNNDGTERWRKRIGNKWTDSSPSIAEDGTVYIGCANEMSHGFLYAIGRAELQAISNGPYYGLLNEPLQFTGTGYGGYPPYSYHWDFGDTHTSEEQNPTHIYTEVGEYDVILTVTDDGENTTDDTTFAWIQETNSPPTIPEIDGPTSGFKGQTLSYLFMSEEPDETDEIWYYIEWGDGKNTGWIGPYGSGDIVTQSHQWFSIDTYVIRAKAKDVYDEESDWATLELSIPRTRTSIWLRLIELFPILQRLLEYIF
jgi:outer membrane protein assembly factor BamB